MKSDAYLENHSPCWDKAEDGGEDSASSGLPWPRAWGVSNMIQHMDLCLPFRRGMLQFSLFSLPVSLLFNKRTTGFDSVQLDSVRVHVQALCHQINVFTK